MIPLTEVENIFGGCVKTVMRSKTHQINGPLKVRIVRIVVEDVKLPTTTYKSVFLKFLKNGIMKRTKD